jgi:hypothetical protein
MRFVMRLRIGWLALAWCVPATAATGVRVTGVFYEPSTPNVVQRVEVGQAVDLVVRVQDVSASPTGVIGGMVDVSWNAGVLELLSPIDANEETPNDVRALFSSPWRGFYSGHKTPGGMLEGIGGAQTPPFEQTLGNVVKFFTLKFRGKALGQTTVTLTGHDFGLWGVSFLAEGYSSSNPSVTVVEPAAPNEPNTPGGGGQTTCLGLPLGVGGLMAMLCGGVVGRRRRPA